MEQIPHYLTLFSSYPSNSTFKFSNNQNKSAYLDSSPPILQLILHSLLLQNLTFPIKKQSFAQMKGSS